MGERQDDLRATGEDLIADAEDLKRIEERKLELGPDDPEGDRLGLEGEELLREMGKKARLQSQLTDEPDER